MRYCLVGFALGVALRTFFGAELSTFAHAPAMGVHAALRYLVPVLIIFAIGMWAGVKLAAFGVSKKLTPEQAKLLLTWMKQETRKR